MNDVGDLVPNGYTHGQLLEYLTRKTLLDRLARLDFPARELPAARMALLPATAREEDSALVLDHGGGDKKRLAALWFHIPSIANRGQSV